MKHVLSLVVATLLATQCNAASGSLQSNDRYVADFTASMTVATVVVVTQLSDVVFEHPIPSQGVPISACVYTNAPSKQYKVTLRSREGGTQNKFKLKHSSGTTLDYYVSIAPAGGAIPVSNVQHNTPYGPYTHNSNTVDCTAAGDSKLTLTVKMASDVDSPTLSGIPTGLYSSNLEIQVDAV